MKILIITLVVLTCFHVHAQQRYSAKKASVSFYSDGVIENIQATNSHVTTILDVTKAEIACLMSNKEFEFPKKLMQVHFNEKYMETEKFPRSSFRGKFTGFKPGVPGVQQVKATGQLTIHGVTREISAPGTIETTDDGQTLHLKSKFIVKLVDYNIKVPQIVWQNIAQQVEVSLDFTYIAF
jgi:hypothetical protein